MTVEQTQIPRGLPTEKPAKIVGLISDTHVPVRARAIPKKVFAVFQNADFIVHAGDLVELAVIDELEQLAPVLAVHGNMDGPPDRFGPDTPPPDFRPEWYPQSVNVAVHTIHQEGFCTGIRAPWYSDVFIRLQLPPPKLWIDFLDLFNADVIMMGEAVQGFTGFDIVIHE